jgi:hypothetical protein
VAANNYAGAHDIKFSVALRNVMGSRWFGDALFSWSARRLEPFPSR